MFRYSWYFFLGIAYQNRTISGKIGGKWNPRISQLLQWSMKMDKDQLLQRFLRYVQIDTTARPETDDYPSSPGQIELDGWWSKSFRR